jgi:SagB-type dehydrogenase family enzyme
MKYVRRARTILASWRGSVLVLQNYHTRTSAPATPLVVDLLDRCDDWQTLDLLFDAFPAARRDALRTIVKVLIQRSLLEEANRRVRDRSAFATWSSWSPEAAHFHFGTKDVGYETQEETQARLERKALTDPPPSPKKHCRRSNRFALPQPAPLGGLSEVLEARRTWRRFGKPVLTADALATLLGHTWRVQQWVQTELGPCALKTSPAGGARHVIEVYVLARAVAGLSTGCYYYDPDAHNLALLRRGLSAAKLQAYLAGQECYADAPAVFVMTAVFERMQWRYSFPRAYRVVLLDAGHLCQTFCLVATALGLAPFCTAALADSTIERDLGLDGITESVIYACGVGTRPGGVAWAPWPHTTKVPRLIPSAFAQRQRARNPRRSTAAR